jgi:hypothetical protein
MSFMDRAVGPSIKLSISAVSENAPRYVVRDRDRVYGARFIQRVRAMGSRSRHARHGKMDMRRGSSARSDVIASSAELNDLGPGSFRRASLGGIQRTKSD